MLAEAEAGIISLGRPERDAEKLFALFDADPQNTTLCIFGA
jgi:hypothetical protein